jgi:hypothetical protein
MFPKSKELNGTHIDLPGRALVGSRTGSSGLCEADPGRLMSYLKLNFGYGVEEMIHPIPDMAPPLLAEEEGRWPPT